MLQKLLNRDFPDSNINLVRVHQNSWDIEIEKTKIRIDYVTDKKFVCADAILCKLPRTETAGFHEYVLHENYGLKSLVFSMNKESIMLSAVIHEDDLNTGTAKSIFKQLMDKALYYDDFFINKYNALRIEN